jgi:ABC-type lipoprotein export system ATPase subunit
LPTCPLGARLIVWALASRARPCRSCSWAPFTIRDRPPQSRPSPCSQERRCSRSLSARPCAEKASTPKLSGGQKQRVAIARALMMRPALVLADEPTGNLDRQTADQVLALLRDMNRADRTTFLISTHDPHVAAFCDRRITVVDGRLASEAELA